jgi:adenine/guanine phosphoribosyltransferase-like PRPP-binding protein
MKHSPYLSAVLTDVSSHANCVQGILRALHGEVEFDAIACTGVSGMLVGPTIAYLMGKRLAVVRKEQDALGKANHACVRVEHNLKDGDRVVILDDLIASGRTIMSIADALDALARKQETNSEGFMATSVDVDVVGYYLYRDHRYETGRF